MVNKYVKKTGFRQKDCLSLLCLGWQTFTSLRLKDDNSLFTNTDKHMRLFVRKIQGEKSRSCQPIVFWQELWEKFLKLIENLNNDRILPTPDTIGASLKDIEQCED